MTVKELITALGRLDPDLTVITNADTGSGIQKVHFVGAMALKHLAATTKTPEKLVAFIE